MMLKRILLFCLTVFSCLPYETFAADPTPYSPDARHPGMLRGIVDTVAPAQPFVLSAERSVPREDQLRIQTPVTGDLASKQASANVSAFALQARQAARILSDYRVEIFIDRSMSMRQKDCPGKLSRWDWCGRQAAILAGSLKPYAPEGLTIVPFACEYDIIEHASAPDICSLFENLQMQLSTRLYEPLAERLDNYFTYRTPETKPLLIAVLTDGIPQPPFERPLVRAELIAASKRMVMPGDLTVIFCQIGSRDPFGDNYLRDLDNNLMSNGSRYHFVHTLSFDEIQSAGLGPSLALAIEQHKMPSAAGTGSFHWGYQNSSRDTLSNAAGVPFLLAAPQDYDKNDRAIRQPNPRDFAACPLLDSNRARYFGNRKVFDLSRMSANEAAFAINQNTDADNHFIAYPPVYFAYGAKQRLQALRQPQVRLQHQAW